jgi:acetoin utilization deacetylase AcuC-like enzyme
MKPTRIRMCHSLVMNYGLYKKMEIFVRIIIQLAIPNSTNRDLLLVQRAKPATKREMTQFHSDEYVDFLSRITPTNMNSYIKEQHKCLFSLCFHPSFLEIRIFDVSDSWTYGDLQIMSVMIVLYSTACSNIARYPPEDRWVRELFSGSRSTSRGSDVLSLVRNHL